MSEAGNHHHRAAREVAREELGVDGRRHQDQLQIRPSTNVKVRGRVEVGVRVGAKVMIRV